MYFSKKELECKCGCGMSVSEKTLNLLIKAREIADTPFINGNVQSEMNGKVLYPEVYGVCREAIKILLDSAFATDVSASNFKIIKPTIRVTGLGLTIERFINGSILDADVVSSSSPLVIGDSVEGSKITGKFKCTSSGLAQRTISVGSTAELKSINWDLEVDSPVSDEFILNTSIAAYGIDGGNLKLKGIFRSSQTGSRVLQLTGLRGTIDCTLSVDVLGAGLIGRTVASFSGAGTYDLNFQGKIFSSNGAFTGGRGITAESNLRNIKVQDSQVGPLDITATGNVEVIGGDMITNTVSIPSLRVTNSPNVDIDVGNIVNTAAGNFVLVDLISCGVSNLRATRCSIANSTSVVIRCSTSGRLNVSNLQVENAGTGAPYGVTGTAKIYGDLSSERLFNVPWTDLNRLSASSFIAGTCMWNATDNAPNYSDGTDWRTSAGVVT